MGSAENASHFLVRQVYGTSASNLPMRMRFFK